MNFYQPQVQLLKRTHMDGPDEYFLHAITNTEQTNCKPFGHAPVPEELNANGALEIQLFYAPDFEAIDLSLVTPVVHTLRIGALPSNDDVVPIEVNIIESARNDNEPKGTVTVSSADAIEIDRPVVTDPG